MKLYLINHNFEYEVNNLYMIFFPGERVEIALPLEEKTDDFIIIRIKRQRTKTSALVYICKQGRAEKASSRFDSAAENYEKQCELAIGRAFFKSASKLCGFEPPWGILTGIRPIKLLREKIREGYSDEEVFQIFQNEYLVSSDKIKLCVETEEKEKKIINLSQPNSFSLYISIPFCPSRCAYCSFVSHDIEKTAKLVPQYVELLCEEIKETAKIANLLDLKLETIYMGGGTPTSLNAQQLKQIFDTVKKSFDFSTLREYTVESGRPDTITKEKLEAILESGAGRISINPQTMDNDILRIIGRNHTAQDIITAFELAKSMNVPSINMDLIAGLPTDTLLGFKKTIRSVLEMHPEAITIHTLAIKRSSSLVYLGNAEYNAQGGAVNEMLITASEMLHGSGYYPYYLYRQKNMVGNLDNVGWSLQGHEGLYNVFIMDETHTILSTGAGGVTKIRQPHGSRIERVFNFKYPYEYISRFDQILDKKKKVLNIYEQFDRQENN
jgi:oxygen-independent coproporphyrinogen-3 oxidase